MDYDQEFDDEYDEESQDRDNQATDDLKEETGLFDSPLKAYLFLSDDVQDEMDRRKKGQVKMKCSLCQHRFRGRIGQTCPQCFSVRTEPVGQGVA